MPMRISFHIIVHAAITALIVTNLQSLTAQTKDRGYDLDVFTTIAPLHYATSQILGSSEGVINTAPPDRDAASYRPERRVLRSMLNADLIVINGASFEEWLPRVSLPKSKILNTADSFHHDWLSYDGGKVHSHGDGVMHSHHGINGHTWLATKYYKKQCAAIYERLDEILEKNETPRDGLKENYEALMQKLTQLEGEADIAFAPIKGKTIAATHASYDYLAVQHGFSVFNTHIDPDEAKIDKKLQATLQDLAANAKAQNIQYLFWESEPSKALANEVEKIGLINVVFKPLESMDTPDYVAGMRDNFQTLHTVLKK